MNLFTQQKQSHGYRKQTSGYQGISEEGINWEIGTDIYTLLYIKQKVLIKTCFIAQGTLLNGLYWPIRENNLKKTPRVWGLYNKYKCANL